jgi:hypothetical protein
MGELNIIEKSLNTLRVSTLSPINNLNSTTMSKSKTVIKYVRIDCALIKTAQKLYELDQVKKNVVALSYFVTNLNTI